MCKHIPTIPFFSCMFHFVSVRRLLSSMYDQLAADYLLIIHIDSETVPVDSVS